jgi:hypothetical protein
MSMKFVTVSAARCALAALILCSAATISAPAHAAAGINKVLGACNRTAGCKWDVSGTYGIVGCSPNACFSCDTRAGTCKQVPKVEKGAGGGLRSGANAGNATASSGSPNSPSNRRSISNVKHPVIVQHSGGGHRR